MAGSSAEFNAAAKALIHDPSEIFGNADAPAWLTLKLLTCTDVDLKKERAVGAKADLALWATWLRLKREVTNRDNVAIDLAIALMPGGQVPSGKTVETSLWPALIDSCARSPCPCRPCSGAASCARAPRPCRPCCPCCGASSCARPAALRRCVPPFLCSCCLPWVARGCVPLVWRGALLSWPVRCGCRGPWASVLLVFGTRVHYSRSSKSKKFFRWPLRGSEKVFKSQDLQGTESYKNSKS